MKAVPISLQQANRFVEAFHRHHAPVHRDKFRVAASDGVFILGVAQVGRPVSRMLDDGFTVEVVRLCINTNAKPEETKNVCSFLYSRCARIAKEMGYEKIITYILDSEPGTSLKAAGWHKAADTVGGSWDKPSRPRKTTAPTCPKQRWELNLN